jgi:hypothetical protein
VSDHVTKLARDAIVQSRRLVRLFADRPELAVGLLRDVLGIGIPEYTEARRDNLDLTDLEPASRYADLVVLASGEAVVLAVVVEIQLEINADKRFSWPAYLANLRAKLRCPVELLVVTPSDRVARWAAEPIPIGQGYIRPVVLGPRGTTSGRCYTPISLWRLSATPPAPPWRN